MSQSESTLKALEAMRDELLEVQVRLENTAKAISSDVSIISSKIMMIRTELLSLMNSERKQQMED